MNVTRARAYASGLTLLEILIVLALVAMAAVAMTYAVGKMSHQDLRDAAQGTRVLLRMGYDRTAMQGSHHRVNIDLEAGTLTLEHCEGTPKIRRADSIDDERKRDEDEAHKAEEQAARQEAQAQDARAPVVFAPLSEAPSCQPVPAVGTKVTKRDYRRVKLGKGVKVSRVFVGHLEAPVESGQVTINFFRPGYAEKAVVELTDGDVTYHVRLEPMSGRVTVELGEFTQGDAFFGVDAEGEKQPDAP